MPRLKKQPEEPKIEHQHKWWTGKEKGTTLSETRLKKLDQSAVDQNGKGRIVNTSHNPTNLVAMKLEALKGITKELPGHMFVDMLHVKLDSHEILLFQSFLQVMHKLLGDQHVIGDATPPMIDPYSGLMSREKIDCSMPTKILVQTLYHVVCRQSV